MLPPAWRKTSARKSRSPGIFSTSRANQNRNGDPAHAHPPHVLWACRGYLLSNPAAARPFAATLQSLAEQLHGGIMKKLVGPLAVLTAFAFFALALPAHAQRPAGEHPAQGAHPAPGGPSHAPAAPSRAPVGGGHIPAHGPA